MWNAVAVQRYQVVVRKVNPTMKEDFEDEVRLDFQLSVLVSSCCG
jgi:hypothetical protein